MIDWLTWDELDAWLADLLGCAPPTLPVYYSDFSFKGWVRQLRKKPYNHLIAILDHDAILAWAAARRLGLSDEEEDADQ